jgi:hypothetical protein
MGIGEEKGEEGREATKQERGSGSDTGQRRRGGTAGLRRRLAASRPSPSSIPFTGCKHLGPQDMFR